MNAPANAMGRALPLALLAAAFAVAVGRPLEPLRGPILAVLDRGWTLGLGALELAFGWSLAAVPLVAAAVWMLRRAPAARPTVFGLASLPAQAFLLLAAVGLDPLGTVALLALASIGAPPRAEGWRSGTDVAVAALAGLGLVVLAATHTMADPLLEAAAGAVGWASAGLGRLWAPVVAALTLSPWLRLPRRELAWAVAGGAALALLDGIQGGWGSLPAFALGGAAVAIARQQGGPFPWPEASPAGIARGLVPTTVIALAIAERALLFGAWDCGQVVRQPDVERLAPGTGAFEVAPVGDAAIVSWRSGRALERLGEGGRRVPLDELLPGRAASRLRPEVVVPTPQGVAVLAVSPAPGVASALLHLSPDLQVLAAAPQLACTEASDAVVQGGDLLVACPAAAQTAEGNWITRLTRYSLPDLTPGATVDIAAGGADRLVPAGDGLLGNHVGRSPVLRMAADGAPQHLGPPIPDFVLDLAPRGDGALATEYLRGGVVELGPDLEPVRRRRLGWGTRALACDGPACWAASAITGRLKPATDEAEGTWWVGGHVRRIAVAPDGSLLAGGDCGVVRVRR